MTQPPLPPSWLRGDQARRALRLIGCKHPLPILAGQPMPLHELIEHVLGHLELAKAKAVAKRRAPYGSRRRKT